MFIGYQSTPFEGIQFTFHIVISLILLRGCHHFIPDYFTISSQIMPVYLEQAT